MKSRMIYFVSLLLFIGNVTSYAAGLGIKAGGNYTYFNNYKINPELGFSFGLEKRWQLNQKFAIAGEILLCNKKANIKNVSIGNSLITDFVSDYVYYASINCNIIYTEFPVLLNYIVCYKNSFKIIVLCGPSFSLAIKDRSTREFTKREFIDSPGYSFDYYNTFERDAIYITHSSGFNLNIGAAFTWHRYTVEYRYAKAFYDMEMIYPIDFYEKVSHNLYLLISYRF